MPVRAQSQGRLPSLESGYRFYVRTTVRMHTDARVGGVTTLHPAFQRSSEYQYQPLVLSQRIASASHFELSSREYPEYQQLKWLGTHETLEYQKLT